MALAGGGGAGNTSNPSGTGTSLNTVGDFAYAYSGIVTVANTATSMLTFTTGNFIVDAKVQFSCSTGTGDDFEYTVELDGQEIYQMELSAPLQMRDIMDPIRLIIPPYSKVSVIIQNVSSTTAVDHGTTLIGRVYA